MNFNYTKPTVQMLGRWQPWHKGHRWLIDQRLKENKKVIAEEGKEILKRKLKQLKFSFNDNIINKLQVFFNYNV